MNKLMKQIVSFFVVVVFKGPKHSKILNSIQEART